MSTAVAIVISVLSGPQTQKSSSVSFSILTDFFPQPFNLALGISTDTLLSSCNKEESFPVPRSV